jgi:hypothetical protein
MCPGALHSRFLDISPQLLSDCQFVYLGFGESKRRVRYPFFAAGILFM